jgi:hypothetical protein
MSTVYDDLEESITSINFDYFPVSVYEVLFKDGGFANFVF